MQQSMLAKSDWLRATPTVFSDTILEMARMREFVPGQAIYQLGDPAGGIYGVVSGAVQITLDGGDEGMLPGHVATPGAWFGEGSIFALQERLVGASAIRNTELAHVTQSDIETLTARNPAAWRWFGLLGVINLGIAIAGGSDLLLRRPRDRCIAVLLRMAGCRFRGTGPHEAAVSHADLASLSNLSRSVVSGILRELQDVGAIDRGYGRIAIENPEQLRSMLVRS